MLGNFIRTSRVAAQTLMTRPLASINSALTGPVASVNSAFNTSPAATQTFGLFPMRHLSTSAKVLKEDVTVTFHFSEKVTVTGREGDNLLDIVINNDVDIDGFGACEGTLACSTCHVIFSEEDFARLPDEATDEEMDMLDLAYGLEETSRLGCQVCMTKELSGITVKVPAGVNDQR